MIRSIQSGEGGRDELKALELATGNPNAWIIFNELEIEEMPPEKVCALFF